jgi:myo-inositol-1(or 4)-monophosphatase
MQKTPIINLMLSLTPKVSKIFTRDFSELQLLQSSKKSLATFIGHTIRKVEGIIIGELTKARPQYGVITPTHTEDTDQCEYRWLICALDSPDNFARALPLFAMSVAIESVADNKILAGMIFAPVLNEIFYAEAGQGAWAEFSSSAYTARLRASERRGTERLLATDGVPGSLCMKSPALSLAYLAAGRIEGCKLHNTHMCEVAAGVVLAQEAGAEVREFKRDGYMCQTLDVKSLNY